MCRKVVETGCFVNLPCWFHATEQCCGDALATAFTVEGRDSWNCLNCFPRQGVAQPPDPLKKIAAQIDHDNWRRAFRILTDSCAGCGLTVRERSAALRCATCSLAFHANGRCTGYDDEELSSRPLAAPPPPTPPMPRSPSKLSGPVDRRSVAAESVSSDDDPVAAAAAATAAADASSGTCTGGTAATDASTRDADSDGDGGASTTSAGGVGSSSSNNGVVGGSGGSSGGGDGSSSSIGGDNGSSRDGCGSSSGGGGGIGNGRRRQQRRWWQWQWQCQRQQQQQQRGRWQQQKQRGVCDGGTSELPPALLDVPRADDGFGR